MFETNSTTQYLVHSILVSLVVYYVVFISKNWKILKFALKERGFFLPLLPLIGNYYVAFITGQKANMISTHKWIKHNIGLPCGVWKGNRYVYIANDPKEIKIILNHPDCYTKSKLYEHLTYLFKQSIFMVPYAIWKERRRNYQKSFKPSVLKSFFPSFYKQSCQLLNEIDDEKQDLYDICYRYSFTNFFYTSVGLGKDQVFDKMERYGQLIQLSQDELVDLLVNPILPAPIWFKFYSAGKRAGKLLHELEGIVRNLVKCKRIQYGDIKEYRETYDGPIPLMDLMMNMTDDRIIEELLFFTTAATDATGIAMAFSFTLLGINPDVQKKVFDEVISVAGYNTITHDHLPELKYTEAAINETLRLVPPGAIIGRKLGADVDIGTKILPKGIDFDIDIYHLHRDPKYWRDPLKFDPTRFLPENAHNIQPYTYLPFSAGPRDCIGKRQAIMLIKTTVASVVRKFKITTKYKSLDDINLMSCVTMRSTHPLDCHFTPRLDE